MLHWFGVWEENGIIIAVACLEDSLDKKVENSKIMIKPEKAVAEPSGEEDFARTLAFVGRLIDLSKK